MVINFQQIIKGSILILLLIGLSSCAPFHSSLKISNLPLKSDTYTINGKYEIVPIKTDTLSGSIFNAYKLKENLLEEFDRTPFTLNKALYSNTFPRYSAELKLEQNYLTVNYLWGDEVVHSKRMKAKLKKDGYLYFKNRNTVSWGVPYLFGVMDVNRQRLMLDAEKNLVLEVSNFRGGAILLIGFMDQGKTTYRKTFMRIE